MKKILIIEDDRDLQEGLAFSLKLENYEILTASTIRQSIELLQFEKVDLIILDCNLPDGSGFEFCTKIKQKEEIPILMLTARDTEMDEVKALELGMDDFMSKPFSLAVLKARIKKLIMKKEPQMKLISSGIEVDKRTCKVLKDGILVECSKIEYQILVYLMENSGTVLSKEQILDYVWDSKGQFVDENTLSVNIRRLRTKIEEDSKNPQRIRTVHGIGYIWKG